MLFARAGQMACLYSLYSLYQPLQHKGMGKIRALFNRVYAKLLILDPVFYDVHRGISAHLASPYSS
ncbi:MAG: hypothetical protein ACI8R8_003273, partial [Paraglaciecola sp.]